MGTRRVGRLPMKKGKPLVHITAWRRSTPVDRPSSDRTSRKFFYTDIRGTGQRWSRNPAWGLAGGAGGRAAPVPPFTFYGEKMITEKWRARFRNIGRVLVYVAAIIYLLALSDKISSMQSDIASIQSRNVSSMRSDVSDIGDGSCANSRFVNRQAPLTPRPAVSAYPRNSSGLRTTSAEAFIGSVRAGPERVVETHTCWPGGLPFINCVPALAPLPARSASRQGPPRASRPLARHYASRSRLAHPRQRVRFDRR
jgi:hypothetical protein